MEKNESFFNTLDAQTRLYIKKLMREHVESTVQIQISQLSNLNKNYESQMQEQIRRQEQNFKKIMQLNENKT